MAVAIATIVTAGIIAAATCVLVAVTAYYARQTRSTVDEMKTQTQQMRIQRVEARVAQELQSAYERQAAWLALIAELRQLCPLLEASGPGSDHIILPSAAWQGTFRFAGLLSPELADRCFQIYATVTQLNATAQLMLNSPNDSGGYGSSLAGVALDRRARCDRLVTEVRAVVKELEGVR